MARSPYQFPTDRAVNTEPRAAAPKHTPTHARREMADAALLMVALSELQWVAQTFSKPISAKECLRLPRLAGIARNPASIDYVEDHGKSVPECSRPGFVPETDAGVRGEHKLPQGAIGDEVGAAQ